MNVKTVTLTAQEKEIVVKELAEMLKNLIYMSAEDEIRKILEETHFQDLLLTYETGSDSFGFHFEFRMVINDVLHIIGKERRK